jgi:hypothetical protein
MNCFGFARMAYGGVFRSCWNFESTTPVGRQSLDTELTLQETGHRDCDTMHTIWSTGRPAAFGLHPEAQVFDHDVSNERKYPELAPQVFMQNIVVNQLREMIIQPHQ